MSGGIDPMEERYRKVLDKGKSRQSAAIAAGSMFG